MKITSTRPIWQAAFLVVCLVSPLRAQSNLTAKTAPVLSLDELKTACGSLQNNKQIIMKYIDIYGVDLDLNVKTDDSLKEMGFSDAERKKLFLTSTVLKNRFRVQNPDDNQDFRAKFRQSLTPKDADLLSDPSFEREVYSAGIGPMYDDVESVGLRIGDTRLGMKMVYREGSPELQTNWVKPQSMVKVESGKHVTLDGVDITEAFQKMGKLKGAEKKHEEKGISGLFSKASSFLDSAKDTYIGPVFPCAQLYVPRYAGFSVRFRSSRPMSGRAIYLIPLEDRGADGMSPAYGWRVGTKGRVPDPTRLGPPYQARVLNTPDWAEMYGVVGNYPNGVGEGLFLAVLAPAGRPLEAEQAFLLFSGKELPKGLLNLPHWW